MQIYIYQEDNKNLEVLSTEDGNNRAKEIIKIEDAAK